MTKKILNANDIDQIAKDPEVMAEVYRRRGYDVPHDIDWSKHVEFLDGESGLSASEQWFSQRYPLTPKERDAWVELLTRGQRVPDRTLWIWAGLAITHGLAFFAGALLPI